MEHQKIMNLLNETSDSKFVARKCNIFNNQSNAYYDLGNKVIYNTEVLKSNLYEYYDAYILVGGDIIVVAAPPSQVAFKNCAPFAKCITKIGGTTIDDAEDVDLLMPMHNLLERSSNYSDTTGSLWFCSKDETTNLNVNITNINDIKSFKYKAKLLGLTVAQPNINQAHGILKMQHLSCH